MAFGEKIRSSVMCQVFKANTLALGGCLAFICAW